MGGWGGVIASALAGGTAGAMSSVAKDIDDQQKAALQAQRDERLAQLSQQTHKANAQVSAQIAVDNVGPLATAASNAKAATVDQDAATASKHADLTRPSRTADDQAKEDTKYNKYGNEVWKGGKKVGSVEKDSEEERRAQELHDARVESLTAGAEAKRAAAEKSGRSGKGDSDKPDKPRNVKSFEWKEEEDSPKGTKRSVDKTTGYTKEVIAAVPEKAAEPGVMGTDWRSKPAVPGSKERVIYRDPEGKEVPFAEVEAKRYEVSGVKPPAADTKAPGVVNSSTPAKTPSYDEVKTQADIALKKPGANVAAIKARFKQITGKEYR